LPNDFTVMDVADAADMINVVRYDMGLAKRERRFPRKRTCLAIYSRCVNGAEDLATALLSSLVQVYRQAQLRTVL